MTTNSRVIAIESPTNERFKAIVSLLKSRGLRERQEALVMGRKIVPEFLDNSGVKVLAVLTNPKVAPLGAILEVANPKMGAVIRATPIWELSIELFKTIDELGTHFPILYVEAPAIPSAEISPPQGLELVAPLQDPANLGALIRSASAFGVQKVWLTKESAHPFLPKCIRGSSGAVFQLPIVQGPSLVEFLSESTGTVSLDKNGTPLMEFKWPQNIRLVVGEEGQGLPSHKGHRVTIPIQNVESLNAVVAASLALFAASQRK